MRALIGLARACHPGPCIAVTVFAGGLAAAAGARASTVALVAAAVLCGQLGIGWLNDLVDLRDDVRAARTDKPLVAAGLDPALVRAALVVSTVACVLLSVALGPGPAVLHLVAVVSAWAYDLGLKRTAASVVPYLVSFGLLPAIAATAAGASPSPAVVVGAALLGAAGHFADTLPDVDADRRTGVAGLPQRLGPALTQRAAAAAVVLACAVVAVGEARDGPVAGRLLLGLAAVAGAVSGVLPRRAAFGAVVGATALALGGVLVLT